MGLFKKLTEANTDETARAFAAKKGVDTTGAIAVGKAVHDGHEVIAVVFNDRVDLHDLGKMGSMTRRGASVMSLNASRIGSVSTHREGISGVLTIEGGGPSVVWKGDLDTVDRLADAIRRMGWS